MISCLNLCSICRSSLYPNQAINKETGKQKYWDVTDNAYKENYIETPLKELKTPLNHKPMHHG